VKAAAPYYHAVAAADTAAGLSPMSAIVPAVAPSAPNDPVSSDEFVGPFSSWINVKIAYGAVGDGVSDDTAAIQNALNAVGTAGHSPVLYFPAGTYKITATLNLAHAIDISLIGQDPSVTSIVWNGAARGTMLYVNGVAYSKFSRLTFNGSSTALIAVDQSKADGTSNYFDTGNEYSDDYFTNAGYGIRGGAFGYGFAETSVERSHFIGNSVAGIALMNFNALDLWVWYSTFQNCYIGVTNDVPGIGGAGNYHVYYSNFSSSMVGDIVIGNTGGFSLRGNYSNGSFVFVNSGGESDNPATIDIVGNTIVNTTDPNGDTIWVANQGPVLLMDNVIRTANSAPPVAIATFSDDEDVESIDNTVTASSTIVLYGGGELIEIGDQVVPYKSVNPPEPALPGTLPNLNRQVFEVPTGSSASAIQSVINLAFGQNGNRPVVHIPYGTYSIDQTLVVPPSDIQIVGDGYGVGSGGTVLDWTGSGTGPVLEIDGPSKATLRDIGITGTADGILVDNIDQKDSRVYMDQAQLGGSGDTQSSLLVNGLDNSTVELENMGVGGLVKVTGGPLSSSGATTPGNVDFFSGSGGSSNSTTTFDVSQGGKLLVRDWWNDAGSGNSSTTFASIHGLAQFTADGDELYQSGTGIPNFSVSSLNGMVTVLTSDIGSSSGVSVSGNGANSAVLGMGLLSRTTATYFTDTASPSGTGAMLNVRVPSTTPGDASRTAANSGSGSAGFITAMLAQARGQNPAVLSSLPSAVSDVRFFRVAVSGINDVTLQGGRCQEMSVYGSSRATCLQRVERGR
jgi:hypothetical protein